MVRTSDDPMHWCLVSCAVRSATMLDLPMAMAGFALQLTPNVLSRCSTGEVRVARARSRHGCRRADKLHAILETHVLPSRTQPLGNLSARGKADVGRHSESLWRCLRAKGRTLVGRDPRSDPGAVGAGGLRRADPRGGAPRAPPAAHLPAGLLPAHASGAQV